MLSERDGKTLLTMTILYMTQEARDSVFKSRMESGMNASYNMLDEIPEEL